MNWANGTEFWCKHNRRILPKGAILGHSTPWGVIGVTLRASKKIVLLFFVTILTERISNEGSVDISHQKCQYHETHELCHDRVAGKGYDAYSKMKPRQSVVTCALYDLREMQVHLAWYYTIALWKDPSEWDPPFSLLSNPRINQPHFRQKPSDISHPDKSHGGLQAIIPLLSISSSGKPSKRPPMVSVHTSSSSSNIPSASRILSRQQGCGIISTQLPCGIDFCQSVGCKEGGIKSGIVRDGRRW